MIKRRKLLFALVPFLLAGCNLSHHGFIKVSFETFKKQVNKINEEKLPKIKSTKIKGTLAEKEYDFIAEEVPPTDITDIDIDLLFTMSEEEMNEYFENISKNLIISAIKNFDIKLVCEQEIPEVEYYCFFGFKVNYKDDENYDYTFEWNNYGYLAKLSSSKESYINLNITYTYEK